jgi:hypothetical protein
MEAPLPETFRVRVCSWVEMLIYSGIGKTENERYMEDESYMVYPDSKDAPHARKSAATTFCRALNIEIINQTRTHGTQWYLRETPGLQRRRMPEEGPLPQTV